MASRGDVLRVKARLGFLPQGGGESVVVVQADRLNRAMETYLCVPLDAASAVYVRNPTAVRVTAAEAGARVEQVAVPTRMRPIAAGDLAPGAVGRLGAHTQAELDRVMRLVLEL